MLLTEDSQLAFAAEARTVTSPPELFGVTVTWLNPPAVVGGLMLQPVGPVQE
jgi:hypothetical protein